ncbi:MAG: hypothetical protein VKJ09_07915 [Leptolyngbya sp.]|nr:hypothetical protein [Leptolyngbya sp.]
MRGLITQVTTVVVLMAGIAACQLPRLRAQTQPQTLNPDEIAAAQTLTAAQLDLLKTAPSLGFDNLIADWTFLNFLQYFGDREARTASSYGVTPKFFEVIVSHDPYFRLPYVFLSGTVSLFAGQPETAVALLDEGLSHLSPTFPPDSYLLWRYKAIDELLFLGDSTAARQSFATAADWAAQSPLPGADESARRARETAEFLRQNPTSPEVQVDAWLQVWANAVNEDVRESVRQRIRNLGFDLAFEGDRVQVVPLESASPDPATTNP